MAQTALVTGTSSGFGLLTAVSLARAGMQVVASMRDLARRGDLDRAAAAAGVALEVVALDVTRPETIAAALARTGPVDVLVNNAGIGIVGSVENTALDELREVFETNFFGAVGVINAVLPGMRERGRGRIINVSSVTGRIAMPATSAYSAAKHALEGFSDALRHEGRSFGIEVSLIEPGFFPTAMVRAQRQVRRSGGPYAAIERVFLDLLAATSEKNSADPQRVADAIVHAATARSPRPRYVVGSDANAIFTLRSLLPARAFEALVRSKTKPKPPRPS
jgi:NAD(P)-dependent dehydrogenase (short-subunit alcohol dehydrogenase family)